MKIALYGVGTADTIVLGETCSHEIIRRPGGVFNGQRFLDLFHPEHEVSVQAEAADAVIISEDKAYTNWPRAKRFTPDQADWHHLMYPDTCDMSIEFLSGLKGTVSADFADEVDERVLPYLDYLFIADTFIQQYGSATDLASFGYELLNKMKPTATILIHRSCEIIVVTQNSSRVVILGKPLDHIWSLGAGDYFASAYIAQQGDIQKAVTEVRNYLEIFQTWPL